jgi:hypothetical protein
MNVRLTLIPLALLAQVPASFDGSMVYDLEHGPVRYRATPHNEVSSLNQSIASGQRRLRFDADLGYLPAILKALQISPSSQTLVFSKTSFHAPLIMPSSPRAIYFNDETYVGWVRGADHLEISTADPTLGGIFYVLEQEPSTRPQITRNDECLQCHHSARTAGVPGHLVRSVHTLPNGHVKGDETSYVSDHRSPITERWGGWYVTAAKEPAAQHDLGTRKLNFPREQWFTESSDAVALMVLTHQVAGHNYLARLNYETRAALRMQAVLDEMDHKPTVEAGWSESTSRRVRFAIEAAVRYLTFADEAPLGGQIQGDTTFAADFTARGPFTTIDGKRRTLREFDLQRRLFRYPLSYLLYTGALDGLEPLVQRKLLTRLREVLTQEAGAGEYGKLDPKLARDAWRILAETRCFPTLNSEQQRQLELSACPLRN